MANSSKRTAAKAAQKETARKALELRKAGASYDAIARQLGLADRGHAHRHVHAALKEITAEPAQEVLKMELERLDALMLAHWVKAKTDVRSAQLVLQVLDRRARYLGLDAPKKVDAELNVTSDYQDVLSKIARLAADAEAGEDPSEAQPA